MRKHAHHTVNIMIQKLYVEFCRLTYNLLIIVEKSYKVNVSLHNCVFIIKGDFM